MRGAMSLDAFMAQLGPFVLIRKPPDPAEAQKSMELAAKGTMLLTRRPAADGVSLLFQLEELEITTLPPMGAQEVLTVGRLPDNDIVVDHTSVSKRHAELRWAFGKCALVDLASTNGTRVNDAPLNSRADVRDGDIISFGDVRFCFLLTPTLYRFVGNAPRGAAASPPAAPKPAPPPPARVLPPRAAPGGSFIPQKTPATVRPPPPQVAAPPAPSPPQKPARATATSPPSPASPRPVPSPPPRSSPSPSPAPAAPKAAPARLASDMMKTQLDYRHQAPTKVAPAVPVVTPARPMEAASEKSGQTRVDRRRAGREGAPALPAEPATEPAGNTPWPQPRPKKG